MALTDAQKDDVRRHVSYPVYGNGITASPPSFGYRYYEWYLILEYRMDNLSTNQEILLTTIYVAQCNTAFNAIITSSDNLDTARAAVWDHNKYEVRDRFNLYKLQCSLLRQFLGVDDISPLMSGMSVVV